MPCKIASMVPRGDGENGTYNPDRFLEAKEQRKIGEHRETRRGPAQAAVERRRLAGHR